MAMSHSANDIATGIDAPAPKTITDRDLSRAVGNATIMRQSFYAVVLLVALYGQASGAMEALHIPLIPAVVAVSVLELGGVVVLGNADVRRRLGERATGSRLFSAAIAAGAVAFNWAAHANHLMGGFFAAMSAIGYGVFVTHAGNQRRDRLRALGALPPTTPAYELVAHWVAHPVITLSARSLAKADPNLTLYESFDMARAQKCEDRRNKNISKVLKRKIRKTVDGTTADIALAVYNMDEIAGRLAETADYDGLAQLIGADLTASKLALGKQTRVKPGRKAAQPDTATGHSTGHSTGQRPDLTGHTTADTGPARPDIQAGHMRALSGPKADTTPGHVRTQSKSGPDTATGHGSATSGRNVRTQTGPTDAFMQISDVRSRRTPDEILSAAHQHRHHRPDITQGELARLLGITDRHLRRIESAVRTVNGSAHNGHVITGELS